jgi:hypothetical protein
MVWYYLKTNEKHLTKVISTQHEDWDKGLPAFMLAYWASIHETTGKMPAATFSGRLTAILGRCSGSTTDYMADLLNQPHDIHHYACQCATDLVYRPHNVHHYVHQHAHLIHHLHDLYCVSTTKCTCSQFAYILITYYYYLLHVSALSGPSLGRNQIQEMCKTLVCITTRNCNSCIHKT